MTNSATLNKQDYIMVYPFEELSPQAKDFAIQAEMKKYNEDYDTAETFIREGNNEYTIEGVLFNV